MRTRTRSKPTGYGANDETHGVTYSSAKPEFPEKVRAELMAIIRARRFGAEHLFTSMVLL